MKKYTGHLKTEFWWIIPIILGISKSNVANKANVYAIHILFFFEIGFNWKINPMKSNKNDVLDEQDFYEVMQQYRHAPLHDQLKTVNAFKDVKDWIRENYQ